jgi:hypothetical protein
MQLIMDRASRNEISFETTESDVLVGADTTMLSGGKINNNAGIARPTKTPIFITDENTTGAKFWCRYATVIKVASDKLITIAKPTSISKLLSSGDVLCMSGFPLIQRVQAESIRKARSREIGIGRTIATLPGLSCIVFGSGFATIISLAISSVRQGFGMSPSWS